MSILVTCCDIKLPILLNLQPAVLRRLRDIANSEIVLENPRLTKHEYMYGPIIVTIDAVNGQEAQLSPRDRAMLVSVEILPIATQQCRNYLYDKSWTNRSYGVGRLKWADV